MFSFEWDLEKAAENVVKHGVSFEEAMSVFRDPLSVTVAGIAHSEEEERYFTVGMSEHHRLVLVCHTDRGDRIRLISVRLATARERKTYEETI